MLFTRKQFSCLAIVFTTSFMGSFLISSVNLALPEIESEFNIEAIKLSWIVTAFLLSSAMFLLPSGGLSDRIGVKKFFRFGIIVFVLSSLIASLSPNADLLIASRFLQGIGAALTSSTGPAILVSSFPPQHRGRVLGYSAASVYMGLAFGPFVGGFITQYAGWRMLFYISTFVGLVVAILAFLHLGEENIEINNSKRPSFKGMALFMPGLLIMVYGSSEIPSIAGWAMLFIGAFMLLMFWIVESKLETPLFNTKLFTKNKLFAFSNLAALINYSATYAIVFLLSLYLQKIKALSPRDAGMILIAQPVVMASLSPVAGRLSDKFQARYLASIGMGLCALGLFGFSFLTESTPIWIIVILLFNMGLGFALFSSPNMNTIMSSVEKQHYGTASGTSATMRVIGQMTSMIIVTLFFAGFFANESIKNVPNQVFLNAINWGFACFAIICVVGIYFSFFRGKINRIDA